MIDSEQPVAGCASHIGALFIVLCILALTGIIFGVREWTREPPWRVLAMLDMFGVAVTYFALSETKFGLVLGLIEIGAAAVGNWVNLAKLSQQQTPDELFTRIGFLVGGIALFQHGLKTFKKGIDAFHDTSGEVKKLLRERSLSIDDENFKEGRPEV